MATDRKKEILKAAEESFNAFGYKATTMSKVSKMAQVGKGTIYTFFKTKEELFQAIMDDFIAKMRETAEQAIQPGSAFEINLHQALMAILTFRQEHQLMIKLPQEIRETGAPEAVQAIEKVEQAILTFLEKHIREGVRTGELVSCDPELTAFAMLRLYAAFVFDWERHHKPMDDEAIANAFKTLMINGIKNKENEMGRRD